MTTALDDLPPARRARSPVDPPLEASLPTSITLARSSPHTTWAPLPTMPTLALAVVLSLSVPPPTTATPILPDDVSSRTPPISLIPSPLNRRADSSSPTDTDTNQGGGGTGIIFIVVPVAVGSLFLVALCAMVLRRRPAWRKALVHIFANSALAPMPEERAMESTSTTPVATGAGVGGREQTENERERAQVLADARRNQRAERLRRQGSQRSVKSLPRYNQDLQDDEMVLVKGDDNLEDSDSPRNSTDLGDRPRVPADEDPTSDPPASASLLNSAGGPSHYDETSSAPSSPMTTRIDITPSSAPPTATRFDARSSSISTFDTAYGRDSVDGGRARSSSDGGSHADLIHHGWGEAPSYDAQPYNDGVEVLGVAASDATPSDLEGGAAPHSERVRRTSGFSRFFNRSSIKPEPPTSYPPNAPATSSSHRPSNSNASSSTLSFMPFGNSSASLLHPVSTRRSSDARDRLTSTSTLSISAPLTDTLVKSTFTTPTKGLTPSQMKFISSTENLGKYAVPYGPSSSRRSMDARRRSGEEEAPPPAFDFSDSSDASPASRIDGLPPTSSTSSSPVLVTAGLPPASASASSDSPATDRNESSESPTSAVVVVNAAPANATESAAAPPSTTEGLRATPALEITPATPISPSSGRPSSAA